MNVPVNVSRHSNQDWYSICSDKVSKQRGQKNYQMNSMINFNERSKMLLMPVFPIDDDGHKEINTGIADSTFLNYQKLN